MPIDTTEDHYLTDLMNGEHIILRKFRDILMDGIKETYRAKDGYQRIAIIASHVQNRIEKYTQQCVNILPTKEKQIYFVDVCASQMAFMDILLNIITEWPAYARKIKHSFKKYSQWCQWQDINLPMQYEMLTKYVAIATGFESEWLNLMRGN